MAGARGVTRGAVLAALGAALLFGAAAPLLKPLTERMPPLVLAGLLYAGAALAVAPAAWRRARLKPLDARNARRLAGAVLAGGVLAPVLMLVALRFSSAAAVALLLSLEVAATALLGALVFRDPLSHSGWIGVAAAVAAGVVLAWGGGVPGTLAALLVGAACLGWALDNHLTALIDALPPVGTTFAKGVVAGATNLLLAAWLTPAWPSLADTAAALAVGGACYGVSIALYVRAAQQLGAVRAQGVFATAPFWGVALAAVLYGDRLGVASVVAIALAATAAVLILRDQHAHPHRHEAFAHAHRHRHDDGHHDHGHPELPADVEHTHPHVHEAVEHSHRHMPDLHHRHRHEMHDRHCPNAAMAAKGDAGKQPERGLEAHMIGRIALMIGAAALAAAATARPSRAADDGKGLFVSLKCTTCHSVSAAGVESKKAKPKGGDLSKVGAEHDAQWIQDLLASKVKTDKDKQHAKFKGTPEQAKTIADWLAGLK